ncbi:MAG: hypothetical protein M3O22_06480 [Pseudomonadota bacterium]|nr:hypothetical protein [Pseudomonadota bacterium]
MTLEDRVRSFRIEGFDVDPDKIMEALEKGRITPAVLFEVLKPDDAPEEVRDARLFHFDLHDPDFGSAFKTWIDSKNLMKITPGDKGAIERLLKKYAAQNPEFYPYIKSVMQDDSLILQDDPGTVPKDGWSPVQEKTAWKMLGSIFLEIWFNPPASTKNLSIKGPGGKPLHLAIVTTGRRDVGRYYEAITGLHRSTMKQPLPVEQAHAATLYHEVLHAAKYDPQHPLEYDRIDVNRDRKEGYPELRHVATEEGLGDYVANTVLTYASPAQERAINYATEAVVVKYINRGVASIKQYNDCGVVCFTHTYRFLGDLDGVFSPEIITAEAFSGLESMLRDMAALVPDSAVFQGDPLSAEKAGHHLAAAKTLLDRYRTKSDADEDQLRRNLNILSLYIKVTCNYTNVGDRHAACTAAPAAPR